MKSLLTLLLIISLCAPVMAENDAPVQMTGGALFTSGGTTEPILVGAGSQSVLTAWWDRDEKEPNNPKARLSLKEFIYTTPGKDVEFEGGAVFAMLQAYPGNFYLGAGVGQSLAIKTGENTVYGAWAVEAAYRWNMVVFMLGGQYLFGDNDRQIVYTGMGVRL